MMARRDVRRLMLVLTVAFAVVGMDLAEGKAAGAKDLRIQAGEVHFQGKTEVKGLSNIKNIGQGIVQVRDKGMKTSMLMGTSSRPGAGPAQRFQPTEGTGIALTPASDKGGVFVAANSGRVGVNDASGKFQGKMHVSGSITSDRITAPYSGKRGPAVLLHAASSHNSILLGKPSADKLKYAIGRGQLADRAMTVSVPGLAEYDGAGKEPLMVYQSPNKILAAVKAGTGNLYVAGNMGIAAEANKKPWKSGTKSNMHVRGEVHIESKDAKSSDAAVFFPRTGKNPSFSIRTGSPTSATAVDSKLFVSGGKGSVKVGINTISPKTALDVRGHMNIQGDDKGSAKIYFPASGANKGFYIRSAASPKSGDVTATRYFIDTSGKTGINTVTPKYGLSLEGKAGVAKGEDILIKKGSLHVNDGIADLDGQHKLTLDGDNNFKNLDVETGFTVGTEKAHEGRNHILHVQGSSTPKVLISQKMMKPVTLMLQSGKEHWQLKGTSKNLHLISTKKTQEKVKFTKKGNLVVGEKGGKEKFAIQIETAAKNGAARNSVWIGRGGLRIKGGILKLAKYKGRPIVWRLYPSGFSNMKDLGIKGRLAVGSEKSHPKFPLYIEKGRTVDVGGYGFMYSSGGVGTVAFNRYIVSEQGQHEAKVHNKKAFSAAVNLHHDGSMHFEGSGSRGVLKMSKLMSINPAKGHVTFEKFADVGLSSQTGHLPLRVKGGSAKQKSSIAFGHLDKSVGLLGATSKFVFLGTRDERKFVAMQHADGHVGIGSTSAPEELTLRTTRPDSKVIFSSSKAVGMKASLTLTKDTSMVLSVSESKKAGKFELKDYRGLSFTNAGGKANTVFDRGSAPAPLKKGSTFKAPLTEFRSGNVGIGVDKASKTLHIGGNHWSQGLLILKNGFGRIGAPSTELEVTELVQLAEHPTRGKDVGEVVRTLAKLVRKNKAKLQDQASSIALMERQLVAMRSGLR
jgi:hypothetical protein